jgi:hypothetical protein
VWQLGSLQVCFCTLADGSLSGEVTEMGATEELALGPPSYPPLENKLGASRTLVG